MGSEIYVTGKDRSGGTKGLPFGAALLSVFICILFGANPATIKMSLQGLGPYTNAAVRFSVAACVIFLWAWWTGKPLRLKKAQFLKLMILGVVFFLQLSFFYNGLGKTSASHGALIANLLPFVVMLLAHFFIPGDGIVLRKAGGLVLGFIGIIVLFADAPAGNSMFIGNVLVMSAVIIWGMNAVYTKRIIAGIHPVQVTMYPMFIASPLFLLCGIFLDQPMVKTCNASVVAALLYQTFVTASFGMVAWNHMIRKYGATSLHSFVFIMPLSGVVLGVLLLGEPVTPHLIISMMLVMAGLIVVNRERPEYT